MTIILNGDTGITTPTDAVTGSTSPTNGIYLPTTNALGFSTNSTERMRIDSSGNVGIGTTSPAYKLQTNGTVAVSTNSGTAPIFLLNQSGVGAGQIRVPVSVNALAFDYFNGSTLTEGMRLDGSGNLLVGTTNTNLSIGIGVKIQPAGYATTPTVSCVGSSSSNATDTYHVYSTGASAFRFYVGYGGTISATSTSITGLSDISLKENIRDLETGLSQVLALKPRRFDWKAETEIGEKNIAGFIAQEVEEVLPELVYEYKYNAEETKKALKMGDMIPTLVKAIQELKAELDTVKAELNTLKGN